MKHFFRGIDVSLLRLSVLKQLLAEELVSTLDVIEIEKMRMKAGVTLSPAESEMALLLSDDSDKVYDVVVSDHAEGSEHNDDVYILVRLQSVVCAWDERDAPEFDIEDILDDFDFRGDYDAIRFFTPVPRRERGIGRYRRRVEDLLQHRIDELNNVVE